MIPYVFVSSTIEDLHHLRDAVRDVVVELGYHPVMSEYGDIGYLPTKSAVESCYMTTRECQVAILLIAKRYGGVGEDGRSITHNEFLAARDARVPVICLIDREIMAYKKLFDANRGANINVPGMDVPDKTFSLIDEITRGATNNAVRGFITVGEARSLLKGQIAHMVGDLLRRGQDPLKADVRELLAEMKTLRHELTGGTDRQAPQFMRSARFLLDEDHSEYREIVEVLFDTVESGIPTLLECESFAEVIIRAIGEPPQHLPIHTWVEADEFVTKNADSLVNWYFAGPDEQSPESMVSFIAATLKRDQAFVNDRMMNNGQEWHRAYRRAVYAP